MKYRRSARETSFAWFALVLLGLCVYFSWQHLQVAQQPPNPAGSSIAYGVRGRVVAVTDGDSLVVSTREHGIKREIRVRLAGIDCPEFGQPFHRQAKSYLSDLCLGKEVNLRLVDQDRYGRSVAEVFVEDRNLSLEMVRAGLAWHFVRYNSQVELATAENRARSQRLGLWQNDAPVEPWVWRDQQGR